MRLDHITVSVPETLSSDVYSLKHHDEFPGDHGEAETHVPIPNTTVKRFIADGTAACPWERRSLPGFFCPFHCSCSVHHILKAILTGWFFLSFSDIILLVFGLLSVWPSELIFTQRLDKGADYIKVNVAFMEAHG